MTQPALSNRSGFQDAARQFRAGRISLAEFTNQVFAANLRQSDSHGVDSHSADGVCLDTQRQARCGFPEAIFGQGKSIEAIRAAVRGLLENDQAVLVTRVDDSNAAALRNEFVNGRFNPHAGTFSIGRCPHLNSANVAVVTAGTSDFRVAAEAWETLQWMGIDADMIQDVGVAGPQRLPPHLARLQACDVVIVVAGFEGALPSVVGGYLACPIIAVPTSNSFGVGWPGLAPLLAMLNSCAPNVAVVNVDAGFRAGYLAGVIAKQLVDRDADHRAPANGQPE